jgi:hypothetical protein
MMRKVCGMYSPVPWGYAPAYEAWPSPREQVCYPVGLHWIVRWVRRLYFKTLRYRPTEDDLLLRRVWEAGYNNGRLLDRMCVSRQALDLLEVMVSREERNRGTVPQR